MHIPSLHQIQSALLRPLPFRAKPHEPPLNLFVPLPEMRAVTIKERKNPEHTRLLKEKDVQE